MDEKQQSFLKRVFDLYNRFGIKSITMDDVARELAMSKKTLYECIKDKAELVEHVMKYINNLHSEILHQIVAKNLNAIHELFEVSVYMNKMMREQNPTLAYDLRKYYPEIFNTLLTEQRARMHDAIKTNLLKGISEGLYRSDMDVEIISKLHMTRLEYRYSSDPYTLTELNSEKVMKEIFIYHMHGIANENGLKELYKQTKNYWK